VVIPILPQAAGAKRQHWPLKRFVWARPLLGSAAAVAGAVPGHYLDLRKTTEGK
jgi:hypothetical protein